MTIRGLQRHKAGVDAVAFKAVAQAAVGLAGGDRQQPALALQPVEQWQDPVEQWFLDVAIRAHGEERVLVRAR